MNSNENAKPRLPEELNIRSSEAMSICHATIWDLIKEEECDSS
jgi:hypothetical protein